MPVRRRDPVSVPRAIPSNYARHDYGIDDSISRMGYLSNAVLEDTYDAAAKSRGKDHELLRSANNAIVSTELHSSPRAAVVSRKVRASSVPPVSGQARVLSTRPSYLKVAGTQPTIVLVSAPPSTNMPLNVASRPVVLSRREAPWLLKARAGSVPPRPKSVAVESANYQPVGTEGLKAHNPVLIRQLRARSVGPVSPSVGNRPPYRAATLGRSGPRGVHPALPRALAHDIENRLNRIARSVSEPRELNPASSYYPIIPDVKERALSRYLYAHRGRFGTDSKPQRRSLADFPLVYVPNSGPGPSNRAKAAIIGSKMEAEDGGKKKRKPRSNYAAAKYREARKDHPEAAVFYSTVNNSGLQSSRPPLPKATDRKAIRDVDGFTRPKNVMSWQYRVESRLSPDDLIEKPPSLSRMRSQIREAQEKMDRHRQLLDRYLDKDTIAAASNRKDNTIRGGSSLAGGDPDHMPVSDLRRRIRRTLAKAKNNADYYRE